MNRICDNAKTLISKFGQDVKVQCTSEKTIKTKAFIQPLRSDYQSPLYGDYLEETKTEQYLYIGLPNVKLNSYASTAVITAGLKNYSVKKVEYVYLSGEVIYERAVLEEKT